MTRLPLLSLLALTGPADAVVYQGNPVLRFRVDRTQGDYLEGSSALDKVRVHHCGGGATDVAVGEDLDPVAGFEVAIPAGDHCGLVLFWDGPMDVDGDGSLGAFTVRVTAGSTTLTLADPIAPVALAPWSVVSGSMSGGGPWLLASLE